MRPLVLFLAIATTVGCGEMKPPLEASDVIVTRSMPGMEMSAGYLTLRNNSSEDIAITNVTSPQFGSVQIHETVVENDIARMRKLDELVVPAGGEAVLERGGKHLMLMKAADSGDPVTLNLYSGETLLLSISAERQLP